MSIDKLVLRALHLDLEALKLDEQGKGKQWIHCECKEVICMNCAGARGYWVEAQDTGRWTTN